MPRQRLPIRTLGFTLLELLVVVSLIALSTAAVSLALRDSDTQALEREAQRLVAVLEAGRVQSRLQGVPVRWEPTADGFRLIGVPRTTQTPDALDQPRRWLQAGLSARVTEPANTQRLTLGPEPLIGAQRLLLQQGDARLWIATDGLGPFAWQRDAP
jgi:general secretion pathway protein H